jgi:ribosomal protein S18 acetylase RimI-like enzyme
LPAKKEFFKLRELVTDDIEECVVFYRQMIEHHRDIYQDDSIPYEEEQKKHIREKLQRTDNNFIKVLAEKEKRIVGLLTLEIKGRTCEIDEILVDKDMRGRGMGQAFAEFARKTAFERKCSEIQVSFAARNLQALRFYHAMGLNCLGMIQIFMPLTERGKEQWYKKGNKTQFLGFDCYY